ncbi:MAG: putative DNA-binding domain-containing protein [Bdellovibrionaceae bacterium]|nr:putative DNA-binding domain-containing protein [Pseudobdellovibrionaceae bacterium]
MKSFYDYLVGEAPQPLDYKPAGTLTLKEAFQVYRQGYHSRLTEVLGDTFELIWKVLGDDLFFEVTSEFIKENPSCSYNLSNYSAGFITFLVNHKLSNEFPFLKDLAQLCWDQKEIFDAPSENGLEGNCLLTLISDEDSSASFVNSVRLRSSQYCIFDIWNALVHDNVAPENWDQPQTVVIYRSEFQVFLKQISIETHRTLKKIEAGETLMNACQNLEERELTSLFHFLAKYRLLKKII